MSATLAPTSGPTYVNFTSLTNDVATYLERGGSSVTDPTVAAQIPRLINLAERKLAEQLKILGMIEVFNLDGGLQAGQSVIKKPDRWRVTVSMNYGIVKVPLFPRSYEYVRAVWPNPNLTQPPQFYADYGYQRWLIGPTADQPYPLEVSAWMLPPLLCEQQQTNFWCDYASPALLYGSLLEAAAFLKDEARVSFWTQLWQGELATLSGMDLNRIMDRASDRREN